MSIDWTPSRPSTTPNSSVLSDLKASIAARRSGRAEGTTTSTTSAPVAEPVAVISSTWAPSERADFGPMMPISAITYAVAGVFDNDKKPEVYTDPKTGKVRTRQKAVQYKVTIETWAMPVHLIQKRGGAQFSRGIQMRSAPEFLIKIVDKNVTAGRFSQAQAARMMQVVQANANDFYGVISDRVGGFNYYPDQFVRLRFAMNEDGVLLPQVTVYNEDDVLVFRSFTDKYLTDSQRRSGLVAQQYLDLCGYAEHRAAQKARLTNSNAGTTP